MGGWGWGNKEINKKQTILETSGTGRVERMKEGVRVCVCVCVEWGGGAGGAVEGAT